MNGCIKHPSRMRKTYPRFTRKFIRNTAIRIGFQDQLLLNAGQKYYALLEHSAILWTFIMLPFVFKTFVLSSFEWQLKISFTELHLICFHNFRQNPITVHYEWLYKTTKMYPRFFRILIRNTAKQVGFQDRLPLNAGQKYCCILQYFGIFIKLPFVFKIFILFVSIISDKIPSLCIMNGCIKHQRRMRKMYPRFTRMFIRNTAIRKH